MTFAVKTFILSILQTFRWQICDIICLWWINIILTLSKLSGYIVLGRLKSSVGVKWLNCSKKDHSPHCLLNILGFSLCPIYITSGSEAHGKWTSASGSGFVENSGNGVGSTSLTGFSFGGSGSTGLTLPLLFFFVPSSGRKMSMSSESESKSTSLVAPLRGVLGTSSSPCGSFRYTSFNSYQMYKPYIKSLFWNVYFNSCNMHG